MQAIKALPRNDLRASGDAGLSVQGRAQLHMAEIRAGLHICDDAGRGYLQRGTDTILTPQVFPPVLLPHHRVKRVNDRSTRTSHKPSCQATTAKSHWTFYSGPTGRCVGPTVMPCSAQPEWALAIRNRIALPHSSPSRRPIGVEDLKHTIARLHQSPRRPLTRIDDSATFSTSVQLCSIP